MSPVASEGPPAGRGEKARLSPHLRARILADPAAQNRLARIEFPDEFDIALQQIDASIGRPPLESDAFRPGPGWLPARAIPGTEPPAFDWLHFGGEPLTQPFFADTVARVAGRPFNRLFRTRLPLTPLAGEAEPPPPSGFIFHMSRCGSTLLANMLGAVPHHHVVSEAEPIDVVVQWAMRSPEPLATRIAALRTIVAVFTGYRPDAARCFVKLDSWHTLALPLFRAAFPDVPWLFLYRDPIEVLASHLRQPGMHVVAGAMPAAVLDIPDAASLPFETHAATALARICRGVLDHWALGGGKLVRYADLLPAMRDIIPAHFGFRPDAPERDRMRRATDAHSKRPLDTFTADGAAKRAAASKAAVCAAEMLLRPAYDELETLRRAHDI